MKHVRTAARGVKGEPGYLATSGVEYLWGKALTVGQWNLDFSSTTSWGGANLGLISYDIDSHFMVDGVRYDRNYSGDYVDANTWVETVRQQVNADGAAILNALGWPWFVVLVQGNADWPLSPYPADPLYRYWVNEYKANEAMNDGAWRVQRLTLDPYTSGDAPRSTGTTKIGGGQARQGPLPRSMRSAASGLRSSLPTV